MELLFIFAIFIIAITLIIKTIKITFGPTNFNIKTTFLNGYKNNNEITKIRTGECNLKFDKEKLYIIQSENQIEDNIADIFHIRLWQYKTGLYMAIRMTTHSEYKFNLVSSGANNDLAKTLMYKTFENISKKLNIKFENCGESEE